MANLGEAENGDLEVQEADVEGLEEKTRRMSPQK